MLTIQQISRLCNCNELRVANSMQWLMATSVPLTLVQADMCPGVVAAVA